jgi:hypothetical protein
VAAVSERIDPVALGRATAFICNERYRQQNVEGWTAAHDDAHDGGEMLRAAVIYFQHAARPDYPLLLDGATGVPTGWPWGEEWWKPKNPQRDLERAGALCLAEHDRIVRGTRSRVPNVTHVHQKLGLIVDALALVLEAQA